MFAFSPRGVCSREMRVELDDDNKIENIQILGGCEGNLSGLSVLCAGQDAETVIARLRGIVCGRKRTSCPDQLSYAIEAALREKARNSAAN